MMNQKEKFYQVLSRFQEKKILEHIVLVGSWAEVIYQEANLMDGFRASTRTFDLDFAIRSRYKQFNPPFNIPEVLNTLGFNLEMRFPDGFEKYDYFEDGIALYVEFLTYTSGRGHEGPVDLDQFNVKAEATSTLNILLNHTILLLVKDLKVNVPSPCAYVMQKMVINRERDLGKREKDFRAIEGILFYIQQSAILIRELEIVYNDLTSKQKKTVKAYCEEKSIELPFPV